MTVLDMSLGGGVLIAAILALRRGLLYRLPKWTFLLLWAVALCRLLIPFAVPSPFSVHTGAAWAVQLLEREEVPAFEPQTPVPPALVTSPGTFREDIPFVPAAPVPAPPLETEPVSPLNAVRLTGTALCGLFFAAAYLWALRRFWDAVPAEADFIRRWQEDHPTWPPVQVKVCGAVSAPLAYGLLRPVILLPGDTDWSDESQLTYVLTHEYVHIRRGDLLWKVLLTVALCVHWFNPLVWVMYLRANQDLELACDEAVVRILGLDSRKKYAYALLAAAESGFSPLCITYTTKNHMEERIRAIMKMKKRSTAVILCAALLVVGVSAVFATSPKPAGPEDLEDLPSAVMTGQTAKSAPDPAPTPAERDVPENTTERVHPITSTAPDASAAPQPVPAAPEQDAEPVQPPVDTSGGLTADLVEEICKEWGLDEETRTHLTNQIEEIGKGWSIEETKAYLANQVEELSKEWSLEETRAFLAGQAGGEAAPQDLDGPDKVPEGALFNFNYAIEFKGFPEGPIAAGTSFKSDTEEGYREMLRQLRMIGYGGEILSSRNPSTGGGSIMLTEDYDGVVRTIEAPERLMPDWTYPVNSKGETYGSGLDRYLVGYEPDLIGVIAITNGAHGYAVRHDLNWGGYPGEVHNPDDALAYMEWQKTQPNPRLVPVYDVNRDHIVGFFGVYKSNLIDYIPGELETVAEQMRQWGASEEEIADLSYYKQHRGLN